MNKKQIELLAPAGSKEPFIAAIQAGADAIYCGLTDFNARNKAKNFTFFDLYNYTSYAHSRNVKVYVTLNTLIKESELKNLIKTLNFVSQIGIDAIIVQDLGIANIILNSFQDLNLHASTQMPIHNSYGTFEAKKIGFKRVVLSRELSLQEIKSISKKQILS
jgi:putative protease